MLINTNLLLIDINKLGMLIFLLIDILGYVLIYMAEEKPSFLQEGGLIFYDRRETFVFTRRGLDHKTLFKLVFQNVRLKIMSLRFWGRVQK